MIRSWGLAEIPNARGSLYRFQHGRPCDAAYHLMLRGFIDREYGVGRKRMDLLVRWPYTGARGQRVWQREAWELKDWRDKKADPLDEGLSQLDAYLAGLGLDAGILVFFDRRTSALPLPERIELGETQTPGGLAG